MKEELEEGHFDAEGHYQWNKDNDIKDNWLDNLDWVKVNVFDVCHIHFTYCKYSLFVVAEKSRSEKNQHRFGQ